MKKNIKNISEQLTRNGLQHRDAQLAMINDAHDAIKNNLILCIEAPTGTGKTLSYTIAGYLAKTKIHTLIISTATIALQTQLIEKDLPLLEKILDCKIHYTLAKGRRHYVCHQRLLKPLEQADFLNDQTDLEKLQTLLETQQWNGDRDQLNLNIDNNTWQSISTDSSGCSGKLCEFYEDCAFFKARKKAHQAEIVVVNHSLLLSDLELGGGAILPEPEKSIYIIDECHHLPSKALDHFSKSDTIMGSIEWINRLTKLLTTAIQAKLIDETSQKNLNDSTHQLVNTLTQLRDILDLNEQLFDNDIWRLETIDEPLQEVARAIKNNSTNTLMQTDTIYQKLEQDLQEKKYNPDEKNIAEKLISGLGFIISRAENLLATFQLFSHQRQAKEAPIAKWFEKRGDAYFCHASPIHIGHELKNYFWNKIENGAVLCSATISALGSFDDFCRRSGLKNHEQYREKSVASFFDYKKSVLYLPAMHHEPAGLNQEAHRREAIELLPELILPNTGTLVLFTSRKAMEETYDKMPVELAMDILMQSFQSKNKLIEKHKNRIRNGERSVLFGLTSFGEGLDLPADFCQHVIIHKLPFAVPSTPIELTRNEWLKKNNLNAFMLSSLPQTSIRLTQYVGRLIRQENDIGIVTILDKRLYTKPYGKQLLANLPAFQLLINQNISTLKATKSIQHLYERATV